MAMFIRKVMVQPPASASGSSAQNGPGASVDFATVNIAIAAIGTATMDRRGSADRFSIA
jgi:hypothetical protein